MKSQAQVFMLVVVFVVLIGGLAFVRNWIATKTREETETGGDDTAAKSVQLDFPRKVAEGRPDYEVHAPGHYDFWFRNPNPQPVEIGLDHKSCTCSQVAVHVLTPEEAAMIRNQYVAGAAPVLAAAGGLLPALGSLAARPREAARISDQPDRWQTLLDKNEGSVVGVPARAAGLVRLSWQGRQTGPQRLTATVWVQLAGDTQSRGGRTTLEAPVLFLNPVQLQPETVPAFTLGPNGQYQFEGYCWSATRPDFQVVSVQEETGNPCFVCSFTRLRGEAFEQVAAKMPVQVVALYRILVTVYERLPGKGAQLDLGPFQHKVIVKTDQADVENLTLTISGTVRGDITVGTGESRDKIRLPTFLAAKGTTATVPIQATHPGLKLAIDSQKPDYLVVELHEHPGEEGKRWDLKVTVPPGRAAGEMPPDSAVVLKALTEPPRLIRVPVVGRAKLR